MPLPPRAGTVAPMDLRPAIPSDLPDIARLHEANWRRDYAGILPEIALGARLTTYMNDRWTEAALDASRVFVARQGDMLQGFASMSDAPHRDAFIDNLHVAPMARAQGVGRALMSAIAVLSIPGALTLDVLSANTHARKICRRWGGRESEEFTDEVMGYEVPAVTVVWPDCSTLVDRLRGYAP